MPSSEERSALGFLKDYFYQSRDALVRHKEKVEVFLAQMEDLVSTNPASSTLRRRMEESERAWFQFENQYNQLRAIAGHGRLQDQGDAEQDRNLYVSLQHRYMNVLSRVKDALGSDQDEGDVPPGTSRLNKRWSSFLPGGMVSTTISMRP